MHEIIFLIILIILIIDFLFENWLDWLNIRRMSPQLPDEARDIYDEAQYARQQSYQRENHRFGILTGSVSFGLMMAMLLFCGFAWVDSVAWQVTSHATLAALIFFGIILFANDIIQLPFAIYDTFVIEARYGFNKTTVRTFILDQVKGWLISAVIGGGLLALIIILYQKTEGMFWLYAWGVVTLFTIFMTMFYSNLIVPLFNKQIPLEEGELRTAIQQFAGTAGFRLDNIFVINGSRRSTKANAYFTGLGPKKRIVLYDTLIEEMTTDEIVAVLAHEIGHYKKRHIIRGLLFSIVQTGAVLFLFSLLIDNPHLSRALGVEKPNFHIGLVAFGMLYAPVSFLLGILMNHRSRKNEFEADAFAAAQFRPGPLASALKKLSQKNLSNLTPHPLYVFFNYSHPPLLQRLKQIQ